MSCTIERASNGPFYRSKHISNPAIGRNDYSSTSGTRTQSTDLQAETTSLDQIRNSPTTAELLRGVNSDVLIAIEAAPENPRQADCPEDVATHSETRDDRSIRDARSDQIDRGNIELDSR